MNVKRLALSYTGAQTLTWNAFLTELRNANAITANEDNFLQGFQRRHDRHGSSAAPARNLSNHPTWVRPHWWGGHQSAANNDAIVAYIRDIGRVPAAVGH